MIQFLIRSFENRRKNKVDIRSAFGSFAGKVGLVSNIVLFIGKLMIGLLSGSVSIMADAINSLSDVFSSLITVVSFYNSGKPADKEHPYGHERFEYVSGLLVSLIIIFVGFQFLLSAVDRVFHPQTIQITLPIIIILFLSIGIKIWQSLFYKNIAEKIRSKTLVAAAKDSLNDVYMTVAVLFSTLIEKALNIRIDGYVAFLVAAYIIYSGIQILREFIDELIGSRPRQEQINEMKDYLSSINEIVGYHDLLIHQYGPNRFFASVHIEVDDRWSLNEAHEMTDQIETYFKNQSGIEFVCHLDPVNLHDQKQQFIYQSVKKMIHSIDTQLKGHDIRLVSHPNRVSVIFLDLVVPNRFYLSDQEILRQMQLLTRKEIGEYQLNVTFDHNYLLSDE